jgi:hypothetical protein
MAAASMVDLCSSIQHIDGWLHILAARVLAIALEASIAACSNTIQGSMSLHECVLVVGHV